MISIEGNIDYLVVQTGYTSLLESTVLAINSGINDIIGNEDKLHYVISIHDSVWGDGLYIFDEEYREKESEIVNTCQNNNLYIDGTIIIKLANSGIGTCMGVIEHLIEDYEYCACFNMQNLTSINLLTMTTGEKILHTSFDCESG